MADDQVKQDVRRFYDQIGWQTESDGFYQNARYEDLRPVSASYIYKCHMRVNRHLIRPGHFLLDAGSGPIQYPAYLTYGEEFAYRLCVDISFLAMKEARKRLGNKGLYVVADVANMPFISGVIDGLVSLHTLHHLPLAEQRKAYNEFDRLLAHGKVAVIVNGWTESRLMKRWAWLQRIMESAGAKISSSRRKNSERSAEEFPKSKPENGPSGKNKPQDKKVTGTFIEKLDAQWLRRELAENDIQILVWRSVSVRFLRAVIHSVLAGKLLLALLYMLEEKYPSYFGVNGQYPLVVFHKSESMDNR
ncbi:MAG: hypothetical protein BGO78_03380 [Chloroflexi bacterium 44-23]|nr:MAG: hypothetical protein BGO78_03380 [Chloroflexi bacterium 44-23]